MLFIFIIIFFFYLLFLFFFLFLFGTKIITSLMDRAARATGMQFITEKIHTRARARNIYLFDGNWSFGDIILLKNSILKFSSAPTAGPHSEIERVSSPVSLCPLRKYRRRRANIIIDFGPTSPRVYKSNSGVERGRG